MLACENKLISLYDNETKKWMLLINIFI